MATATSKRIRDAEAAASPYAEPKTPLDTVTQQGQEQPEQGPKPMVLRTPPPRPVPLVGEDSQAGVLAVWSRGVAHDPRTPDELANAIRNVELVQTRNRNPVVARYKADVLHWLHEREGT